MDSKEISSGIKKIDKENIQLSWEICLGGFYILHVEEILFFSCWQRVCNKLQRCVSNNKSNHVVVGLLDCFNNFSLSYTNNMLIFTKYIAGRPIELEELLRENIGPATHCILKISIHIDVRKLSTSGRLMIYCYKIAILNDNKNSFSIQRIDLLYNVYVTSCALLRSKRL